MTDYGHPITFGVSRYPSMDELATMMRLASLADAAGLDYVVAAVRERVRDRRAAPAPAGLAEAPR